MIAIKLPSLSENHKEKLQKQKYSINKTTDGSEATFWNSFLGIKITGSFKFDDGVKIKAV